MPQVHESPAFKCSTLEVPLISLIRARICTPQPRIPLLSLKRLSEVANLSRVMVNGETQSPNTGLQVVRRSKAYMQRARATEPRSQHLDQRQELCGYETTPKIRLFWIVKFVDLVD